MAIESLHAPWRMDYIRTLDKPMPPEDCFLCRATAIPPDDQTTRRQQFVLWTTPVSVVMINLYPYSNGHLLVAPKAHKPDFEQLTPDELHDLQVQTSEAVKLLKRAISPQGFNIGINLGRCAGAGIPGHIHQHVVPRWAGDQNFMPIIAKTKTMPQLMADTRRLLADAWPG